MIKSVSPTNASIKNTGAVYSHSDTALNAMVALNAMIELGGRDVKVGQKPLSALAYINNPFSGLAVVNLPDSGSVLLSLPYNGKVLKGYETNIIYVPTLNAGSPMGLLLTLTYS